MIATAFFSAAVAGLLACLLLAMESIGKKLPTWVPCQGYLWWLCVLVFFGSVLTVMLSNI
jgi:hypothetical protein